MLSAFALMVGVYMVARLLADAARPGLPGWVYYWIVGSAVVVMVCTAIILLNLQELADSVNRLGESMRETFR